MNIVLCVTGSVAATQSIKLAREFKRDGHKIKCFMTEEATKIIHPNSMEFATGESVILELTGAIEHVKYSQVDLILVAPATANCISKFTYKIADNPVNTLLITAEGHNTPILFVPSMHDSMYTAIKENIEKSQSDLVSFMNPRMDEGKAKFPFTKDIILESIRAINKSKKDNIFKNKRILISLGGTYEPIDPIRGITNKSSGKMGLELAKQAYTLGADLTLLKANTTVNIPPIFNVIPTETTEEMRNKACELIKDYDIFFATAAVSDFKPIDKKDYKISSDLSLSLDFKPVNKIIKELKDVNPDIFLVGFKADYKVSEDALIESACNQIDFAGTDLVIANDVGKENCEFGSNNSEIAMVTSDSVEYDKGSKKDLAINIFNKLESLL